MNKIGFIVDNLELNQLNLELFQRRSGFLFVKELSKTFMDIKMAVMDISEIWGFDDGVLIATSVDTALFLQKCVCNSRKIVYLYDYEDLKQYESDIVNLVCDKNLEFFVRSEFYAQRALREFGIEMRVYDFCTKEQDVFN
jgi:hypothetical protein